MLDEVAQPRIEGDIACRRKMAEDTSTLDREPGRKNVQEEHQMPDFATTAMAQGEDVVRPATAFGGDRRPLRHGLCRLES